MTVITSPKVTDFLDEFVGALRADLERGQQKWGDTWLHRTREGQETRIGNHIRDYFDQYEHAGTPVNWSAIAGEAMIAWVREKHPELFPK